VALVAGRVRRKLALFPYMNFWMDLKRVHKFSPNEYRRMRDARSGHLFGLQGKDLARVFGRFCVNSPESFGRSRNFGCGGEAAAFEDCKLSLNETFGWPVDTVKAAASQAPAPS
jgi:hypothetical protein